MVWFGSITYAREVNHRRGVRPALLRTLAGVLLLAIGVTGSQNPAMAVGDSGLPTDLALRIIGGTTANSATTSFFLQFTPRFSDTSYMCGATAISSQWAVTAAHCVTRPGEQGADVGPGGSYLQVNPPTRDSGTRHYLDRIVVHPGYLPSSRNQLNDLALLHSATSFGNPGLPINSNAAAPAAGSAEQVFGFGETVSGDPGSKSRYLRVANVFDLAGPFIPTCGDYGTSYNGSYQICAGVVGGGIDACQGDSGGPLVADLGLGPQLVGIVSAGTGCALAEYPGLYTRVSTYAPWILGYITPTVTSRLCGTSSTTGNPNAKCSLSSGHKLQMKVRNGTSARVTWRADGSFSKLRIGAKSGRLRPGNSVLLTVQPKTNRMTCARLQVAINGQPQRRYAVALNGMKKSRCTL